MGKESDPHDQESLHFAQQIAKRLEVARNEGQCSAFMIAAPPEFLGKLRKELSEQTAKLVGKKLRRVSCTNQRQNCFNTSDRHETTIR
jgi:protein required for attachment to host cells